MDNKQKLEFELNNFIKQKEKEGKIIELSNSNLEDDALTNEEILYYVKEKVCIYPEYDIGDIIFVNKYTYENKTNGKSHMFVIIDKNNISIPIEYFSLLISSKTEKLKYKENILLKKNNKNNLKTDSIIKTDYVYKINGNNVIRKIGSIDNETLLLIINESEKNTH